MNKKVIYTAAAVGVAVIAIGGFFWYRSNQQSKTASQYETAALDRGSLTSIVGATGTVRANQTALLNWQTNGTVESVNVEEGKKVQEGQVLAKLKADTVPANITSAQAELVSAQRNLDNVKSSNLATAQAQLALADAQKAYDDTKNKADALKYKRATPEMIKYAESQLTLAQIAVDHAQGAFNRVSSKSPNDPVYASAYSQLHKAQQAYASALRTLTWYKGTPTNADVAKTLADFALAEAKLQDAQREWERLKDGADPKDIAAAQARVDAIKATLNLANITAPFSGTITHVDPKSGDQVSPGTSAFRLDDLSHMLVDVQVSEVDINNVAPGQNVVLTFDANPGQEYKGVVSNVGQVGNPAQGSVNFVVTVELTDPDKNVKPGMTAAVTINVKELADVLLVPNQAVRYQDAKRVVYVLKNGVLTPVEIQLGATSDIYSELITNDLKQGDEIVLNPPAFTFGPGGGGGGGGMFGGNQ
jgi:HlyD family secretion protein